jgi:ABC-type lipoprotein release transport system permease subunit
VAEHAHEALPRLPLLLAQRASQIGEPHQLVGQTAQAQGAPANLEAAARAGQVEIENLVRLASEVSITDPLTLAATAVVLVASAVLASWIPARPATRVDPAISLRAE